MCGITGVFNFHKQADNHAVKKAIAAMAKRGPDGNGIYLHNHVCLGHARLAIIDVSDAARQPFTETSGRFTIVFNGEFFNYQFYRQQLINQGVNLVSSSDTEVLLHLYMLYGTEVFEKINGFFAFAIYDHVEESLFLARDRMGIKPLLVFADDEKLVFASEMKALFCYDIPRELDVNVLYSYGQLNYVPGNSCMIKNVHKLTPGTWLKIDKKTITKGNYYSIPKPGKESTENYGSLQKQLYSTLEDAVKIRLIADVPLGAFLSGGIDSSVIVALASKYTQHLNTFSIGYRDEAFYDETHYAQLVASKYKTNHTVFSLSNQDLYEHLFDFLEYIDEPFADSSALAFYILSHHTRGKVTVALSGDGADELFGGYHKHMAHFKAIHPGLTEKTAAFMDPLWKILPKSRLNPFGNKIRQLYRFSQAYSLSPMERYWRWCSLASEKEVSGLLRLKPNFASYNIQKEELAGKCLPGNDLNQILYADQHLVLGGDMLVKADWMSMANSLEVRTPFLDYRLVDFASKIPSQYKVDGKMKKKILQDCFREALPTELYNRPKKGFEVPLLKWMQNELNPILKTDLLNPGFLEEQGIFNPQNIQILMQQLHSPNPGDTPAKLWGLLVFQFWWKKFML